MPTAAVPRQAGVGCLPEPPMNALSLAPLVLPSVLVYPVTFLSIRMAVCASDGPHNPTECSGMSQGKLEPMGGRRC